MAACGVPVSVLGGSDGTFSREGLRQFLHTVIQPVADDLAVSIGRVFDMPGFGFKFDRLMASDLSGRARAFGSMVQAGMEIQEAARIAMLMDGS